MQRRGDAENAAVAVPGGHPDADFVFIVDIRDLERRQRALQGQLGIVVLLAQMSQYDLCGAVPRQFDGDFARVVVGEVPVARFDALFELVYENSDLYESIRIYAVDRTAMQIVKNVN